MFQHLPVITIDSIEAFMAKELPYFADWIKQRWDEVETVDQAVDLACWEFREGNPRLVRGVRACVFAVTNTLVDEGVSDEVASTVGALALADFLALLRLIDRTLEAADLERRL